MKKSLLIKLLICFTAFSLYLYSVLKTQHSINYLSYKLPKLEKELKSIEEDNVKLSFQIEAFNDPQHLLDLLKQNAYSHLKYPVLKDVLNVQEGIALKANPSDKIKKFHKQPQDDIAIAHR